MCRVTAAARIAQQSAARDLVPEGVARGVSLVHRNPLSAFAHGAAGISRCRSHPPASASRFAENRLRLCRQLPSRTKCAPASDDGRTAEKARREFSSPSQQTLRKQPHSGGMNSTLIWYTARASGLVTWALLAAGMLWGLVISSGALRARVRQAWLLDLHRFLAAAAVVFLAIHVTSIVLDTYVNFGVLQVLVPFTGSWHPGAVAWGVAGLYLLLALETTSLIRARLPKRLWRSTHYLSFPLFAVATVHGLTAGTDRHTLAMQAGFIGVAAVVTLLTAYRAAAGARERHTTPLGAGAQVQRAA